MGHVLTGDQLRAAMRKLGDLMRQFGQGEYPHDPALALAALQAIDEGRFGGQAQIVVSKHLIDCDVNPFVPDGWKVEQHRKAGQLEWNPERISLYLSKRQKNGGDIGGHDLRKELESQPVLNACVLDYLLANPELIPESWRGKAVFFWGTIYRDAVDRLYVRHLYWYGGGWGWYYYWLGGVWRDCCTAALLASV